VDTADWLCGPLLWCRLAAPGQDREYRHIGGRR